MDARYEVVRVVSDHSLIDSESYEHRYRTPRPLTAGFYVVIWPPSATDFRYDEQARFIGPYRARALAEDILESHLWEALHPLDRLEGSAGHSAAESLPF